MLTRTPPTAAFMRALNHPLKPPFQINSNISDAVHRAIMKGMEMDATKRPQSVEKWLAMLPQATLGNWGQRGGVLPTIPSPQPAPQRVNLISAKGVDYRQLDRLLASGKWKEADEETNNKMAEAAGRTKDGWFRSEDIYRFPCEDLRTIDQLWVKYSNGRFGFSVQKRIYESLGGSRERELDRKIWEAFCDRVGWRVNNRWLDHEYLKFYTHAPGGHLPMRCIGERSGGCCIMAGGRYSSLASRLVECNI
jgi:serine/threonine-protein kinase